MVHRTSRTAIPLSLSLSRVHFYPRAVFILYEILLPSRLVLFNRRQPPCTKCDLQEEIVFFFDWFRQTFTVNGHPFHSLDI